MESLSREESQWRGKRRWGREAGVCLISRARVSMPVRSPALKRRYGLGGQQASLHSPSKGAMIFVPGNRETPSALDPCGRGKGPLWWPSSVTVESPSFCCHIQIVSSGGTGLPATFCFV